jgi:hypothetical protein
MKRLIIYFSLIVIFFLGSTATDCKKSSESISGSGTVYFLVAEITSNHGDSFVLPLTAPEDIAAAERIISGTQAPQIVHARITRGSGDGNYLNKDLAGSGRVWSWHVVEFLGFVDVTAEIYDSWPTYVEEHLDEWMQQNNGIIGFWTYTVIRKVNVSELK